VRLTASFWQVTRFAWMTDDERVMPCYRRHRSSLIRIAVAKREDDEDDDELRIRCWSAINRQNPPPVYRRIELTMLRREERVVCSRVDHLPGGRPVNVGAGRVDYVSVQQRRAVRLGHSCPHTAFSSISLAAERTGGRMCTTLSHEIPYAYFLSCTIGLHYSYIVSERPL